MGIKVTYTIKFKEKDDRGNIINPNNVISTIKRDISWGTFISDLSAVNQTLRSNNSASKFEPQHTYFEDDDKMILEFHQDQFNFYGEGLNHFLTTIAGDIIRNTGIDSLMVEDIEFDVNELKYFKGPKVGIAELRSKLLKKSLKGENRPIVAYSIKPRMGVTLDEYEKIIHSAALSNIDIIEEDERLVDPINCPFGERLKRIQKVIRETKTNSTFSVNLSGNYTNLKEKAVRAFNSGVRIFKFDVLSVGFDALIHLRNILDEREFTEPVALTVFPDVYGNVYRCISRESILKLSRLCGADILYAGSPHISRMGSMSAKDFERDINRLTATHKMLSKPIENIKSTLPTITHDVHPGVLEKIVYSFRILAKNHNDYAFFIGGGISGFPTKKDGVKESCEIWMNLIRHASIVNLDKHLDLEKIDEVEAYNLKEYETKLRSKGWYNDLFKKTIK